MLRWTVRVLVCVAAACALDRQRRRFLFGSEECEEDTTDTPHPHSHGVKRSVDDYVTGTDCVESWECLEEETGGTTKPPPKTVYYEDDFESQWKGTCAGKCGGRDLLSCDCSPECLLLGTCCEDVDQECPDFWRDTDRLLGTELLQANVSCPLWSRVLMIDECPPGTTESEGGTSGPLKSSDENEGNITAESTSKMIANFIANNVPVYDRYSGLTFSNSRVLQCYERPITNPGTWILKIPVESDTDINVVEDLYKMVLEGEAEFINPSSLFPTISCCKGKYTFSGLGVLMTLSNDGSSLELKVDGEEDRKSTSWKKATCDFSRGDCFVRQCALSGEQTETGCRHDAYVTAVVGHPSPPLSSSVLQHLTRFVSCALPEVFPQIQNVSDHGFNYFFNVSVFSLPKLLYELEQYKKHWYFRMNFTVIQTYSEWDPHKFFTTVAWFIQQTHLASRPSSFEDRLVYLPDDNVRSNGGHGRDQKRTQTTGENGQWTSSLTVASLNKNLVTDVLEGRVLLPVFGCAVLRLNPDVEEQEFECSEDWTEVSHTDTKPYFDQCFQVTQSGASSLSIGNGCSLFQNNPVIRILMSSIFALTFVPFRTPW